MSKEILLFVYGSLRKNSSHNHLLQSGVWMFEGKTKGKLFLIDWYPGMIVPSGDNHEDFHDEWVLGDVYRVSMPLLLQLDTYEGPGYDRGLILVYDKNQVAHQTQVYIYNQNVENKKRICPADWVEYTKTHHVPKPDPSA